MEAGIRKDRGLVLSLSLPCVLFFRRDQMLKFKTKEKVKAIVANWLNIKPEAEFFENMYQILNRHHDQVREVRTTHIRFEDDLKKMSEGINTLLLGLIMARAVNQNSEKPTDSSHNFNLRLSRKLKALFFKKQSGGAS